MVKDGDNPVEDLDWRKAEAAHFPVRQEEVAERTGYLKAGEKQS